MKIKRTLRSMKQLLTADDQNNMPLPMAYALRELKLPFEFHIYPTGGYGYGLRPGNPAAVEWLRLAEKWLTETLKN